MVSIYLDTTKRLVSLKELWWQFYHRLTKTELKRRHLPFRGENIRGSVWMSTCQFRVGVRRIYGQQPPLLERGALKSWKAETTKSEDQSLIPGYTAANLNAIASKSRIEQFQVTLQLTQSVVQQSVPKSAHNFRIYFVIYLVKNRNCAKFVEIDRKYSVTVHTWATLLERLGTVC